MSAENPELKKITDQILLTALSSVDSISRASGTNARRFRHSMFGSVLSSVMNIHADLNMMLLNHPEFDDRYKMSKSTWNTVFYVFTVAILELARDGSTQWDDAEILAEQLKHQIRNAMRSGQLVDPSTGKPFQEGEGAKGGE